MVGCMTKTLNEVKVGEKAEIASFTQDQKTHAKLLSLGILPGDKVEILSKAVLGGPISCQHINNKTFFALRRSYAKQILVKA